MSQSSRAITLKYEVPKSNKADFAKVPPKDHKLNALRIQNQSTKNRAKAGKFQVPSKETAQ